jgi:P27 family predicted phage terminase small subunit
MARGRHPKHPEIRRLDGNPGKRPIPEVVIVPQGEAFIPDHLDENARACAELIIGRMPPGLYTAADSYMIAAFATAWSLHRQASLMLRGQELVTQGSKRPQRNPLLQIINTQARLMATLGARLGVDPIARIGLELPEERPPSKFEGLLGLYPKPRFQS